MQLRGLSSPGAGTALRAERWRVRDRVRTCQGHRGGAKEWHQQSPLVVFLGALLQICEIRERTGSAVEL